jgi:hypothetical protein
MSAFPKKRGNRSKQEKEAGNGERIRVIKSEDPTNSLEDGTRSWDKEYRRNSKGHYEY